MESSRGELEPEPISGVPGILKNILVGTVKSIKGPFLTIFTVAGAVVGWKLWLQEICLKSWKFYLPDSVFFLCLFGLAVSLSTLRLIASRRIGATKDAHILLLPKRSKLRLVAWGILLVVITTCVISSVLCWNAHYRPAKFKEGVVILVDQFKIGGWENSDFFTPIKNSLEIELAAALPDVKTLVDSLTPPIGIVDAEDRLDWARRSGTRLVIFATGSRDKIQPHIVVCADSVPQLRIFSDLDADMRVDLPTASNRSRSNPRYQYLEPTDKHRLCIIEELTPQRVAYLVDIAMGLICLYEKGPQNDRKTTLLAADQFFRRAISIDNGESCDLDFCEALYYSGHTKLQLAMITPGGDERTKILNAADSLLTRLLMIDPNYRAALFCQGSVKVLKGDFGEAASCFDRFGQLPAADSSVFESLILAVALNNRAQALSEEGKYDVALGVYNVILSRLESSDYPFLRLQTMQVLNNKAYTLSKLGRFDEALVTYSVVVDREANSLHDALRIEAANAMVCKGITFDSLKKTEEAITEYRNVISRFGSSENPLLQDQVVRAAANLGALMGSNGDYGLATRVLDSVINQFGSSADPLVQERVAIAWFNKTGVLRQEGRTKEALAVLDSLIDFCEKRPGSTLDEALARAIYNKGAIFTRLEDTAAAIGYYDQTIERFLKSSNPGAKLYAIRSLVNKGGILQAAALPYDAIACCNLAAEISEAAPGPLFEEQYVMAMANKGMTLLSIGSWKELIRTSNELINRFEQSPLPYAHRKVGEAMLNKAAAFLNLDQTDSASVALCATLKYCDNALNDIRDSVLALQHRNKKLDINCN